MIDWNRIADRLLAWEALDSAERPEDPAELFPADAEEAAELRRRAELLRRFDAAFGTMTQTVTFCDGGPEIRAPEVPGCVIRGMLGRGGMGVVYRAWQVDLKREVAVKVLPGSTGNFAARSRRFVREAQVLARLRHDHIVPVYEAALYLGEPYFVMELMTGGSLAGERHRFADPRAAAALVEQVARAVDHAHGREILHRDLKPANILLDELGRPRVSDFGLAKLFNSEDEPAAENANGSADTAEEFTEDRLTTTDAVVGTPVYMAPEQFVSSAKVGPAVDIWALGVILYELLAARRPFGTDSPGGLAHAISKSDPPRLRSLRPELPADLEAVVLKCLSKDPADRYASAGALADDLRRWLDGYAPLAYPDGPVQGLYRVVRRRKAETAIAVLVVAGAVTAGAAAIVAYRNDPERAREAIAASLQAGRRATFIGSNGPPRSPVVALGAETSHQSKEFDRPFFVSTHGVTLIELWSNPPPSYRFEIECRHEDSPAGGSIGLFFDHSGPDPAWPQPRCYVFRYADRGSTARQTTFPGGLRGNRVGLTFQNFELRDQGVIIDHVHKVDERLTLVPPEASPAPSPWRRLRVDVGGRGVAVTWSPGEGAPDQQYRVDDAFFERHARLLSSNMPELRHYVGRPAARGALGLYVNRSAASFRNATLEPLSVDP